MPSSPPIDFILLGAGNRGAHAYASYALAHPQQARCVAVAEPDFARREQFADQHDLGDDQCFDSWEALLDRGQMARAAIVTTQDQMHVAPAIAAMETGYDVLLEKPMAHSLAGCVQLVQAAERTGRLLQICHVLRYSPFWQTLHQVIQSGRLGDIITVEHRENVAYWHMAHSFVRGNWRNEQLSNPMILAKCCHDLDILVWNLEQNVLPWDASRAAAQRCVRLSSFGSLLHYRSDSVGPEIPLRCTDGCPIEPECQFSAPAIYLDLRPFDDLAIDRERPDFFLTRPLGSDLSRAGRLHALETGPYGRCVYRCDNDVVDHQVVSMEWSGGPTVTLIMHGHSDEEHRSMRYDGTRATLRARFGSPSQIEVRDHLTGNVEEIPIPDGRSAPDGGHGGGDHGIVRNFIDVLRGEAEPLTTARASLESHLLAFAAEEARREGKVVEMADFRARAEELARDGGVG